MWVPALDNTPLNFLQDVVQGNKKLFPDSQVKKIDLIRWPEFAVKHIWPHALKNPLFLDYIPSGWGIDGGGRKPEKLYTWGIICTLEHRWINENLVRIDAARTNHRNEHRLTKEPDIKLDPFWAKALLCTPFVARKYSSSLRTYFPFHSPKLFCLLASEHGKGTLMHKVKPPAKIPPQKLLRRRKPPKYTISDLTEAARAHEAARMAGANPADYVHFGAGPGMNAQQPQNGPQEAQENQDINDFIGGAGFYNSGA